MEKLRGFMLGLEISEALKNRKACLDDTECLTSNGEVVSGVKRKSSLR